MDVVVLLEAARLPEAATAHNQAEGECKKKREAEKHWCSILKLMRDKGSKNASRLALWHFGTL